MRTFGLIGYPLTHSFSKKYFTDKFSRENIMDVVYENFPIESIEYFPKLWQDHTSLVGLNVTIPYKEQVIPYLDLLDDAARRIGAVNVIKKMPDGRLKGYNSDYYGFKDSLVHFLRGNQPSHALVLGTGGASKAVVCALEDIGISHTLVSRVSDANKIAYEDLTTSYISKSKLIVNTSPLGMYPKVDTYPDLPYNALTGEHFLYDLVYNPEITQFMSKGKTQGAQVMNGLPMLVGQAEKAWEIWNEMG